MPAQTATSSGRRAAAAITSRAGALIVLLATAGLAVLAFATSPAQPQAQPADGLAAGKQSTRVTELAGRFPSGRIDAALVVVERQNSPLTAADTSAIQQVRDAIGRLPSRSSGSLAGPASPAITSPDGQAALLTVPLKGGLGDDQEAVTIDDLRAAARGAGPGQASLSAGLSAQVTGGPAFSRDISAAFDGADVTLLAATAGVVAVLLLLTYRSPILWIVPLLVIGMADQVVAQLLPWVAKLIGERTDAAVSGIVSVLVFGAGTDYALLLLSRYREELRQTGSRRVAMARALTGAAPAIIASAATVVLALLTLLAGVLTSNRTLGISSALGIVVALVFGLVVLPATLVCLPRGVFWPFVPKPGSADPSVNGAWARIAQVVTRRPVAVLTVSVAIVAALSCGTLSAHFGLSQTEQFRTKVESVTAQEALARHFPAGLSQPLTVIAASSQADEVTSTARNTSGVAQVSEPERSGDGRLIQFSADLTSASGTPEADRTIDLLRSRLAAIDGATALVGGDPATDLDQRNANMRDDVVIAPLILAVVLLVLTLLLRSLVAPVLLLLTVIASFAASLGAGVLVLRHVFGIPALDAGVPLLSFLFLVALGVDYNIFLITRSREEAMARGSTRAGVVRALAATGGVITSAGILLAAVFTVLGVLPVIVLTQIGVIVGLGVLLDTLLVRTLLVPAIAILLGERFWWPARPVAGSGPVPVAATATSGTGSKSPVAP